MSKAANEIEQARRLYVAAMGTPMEREARKLLEAVVEKIKAARS